jgi:hypothetical protein
MPETSALDFRVRRDNLRVSGFASSPQELKPGAVLLKIEKFAFTANNVTYAVFGEAMQYWNFFPLEERDWGRIPVWGYAAVVESRHEAIRAGERVYGYLPMSTHLTVHPDRVTEAGFMDGAPHRRALPAAYQAYSRCAGDPLHDAAHEDARALLHPLFFTSFLIEDFLSDHQLFGAQQVVLASASSRTALGVAFLLSKNRPQSTRVIGLTSPGNQSFCEKLGYYDQVVEYAQLESLPRNTPTVFVDMAGEGKLLHGIHHHFGENLKYSCIVGATHWERRQTQHQLPGAKPQFFFAPTQGQKRRKDWGPGGLEERFAEAWSGFLPSVRRWLQVRHWRGPAAVQAAYLEVLEGKAPPQAGYMLSL